MSSFQFWQLPPQDQRKDENSLSLQTSDQIPQSGPSEVLLRVRAVSLNFRDLIIARNAYPLELRKNELIPASDGAGEIVGVGDQVKKFKKGDRVAANFNIAHLRGSVCSSSETSYALGGPIHGMLSQFVVLPAQALVHIPNHLSFEEAATLPCAAVTAWNGLFGLSDCPVLPGSTILAEGTGGVSVFAAQFAIAAGAKAVITSSSDDKLNKVPEWDQEVRKVAGTEGVSHIIEVGGAGTLEKAHAVIKRGGVIANIGFVAQGETPNIPLLNLTSGSIYRAILVGSVEQFEDMNRSIDTFQIKPIIDQVFSFKDAPKAYAHQWSQAHVGKVVIKVD